MTPSIVVNRKPSEADWTLSEFSINGIMKGVGVEDESRIEKGTEKVFGETRIPNGIFEIDLVESPKFSKHYFVDKDGYLSQTRTDRFAKPHLLIHVKGVPGFSAILWHWGNTDLDSHGCYIVGSSFLTFDKRKGVTGSRKKYTDVYPEIFRLITKNNAAGIKTYVEYKDAA